MFPVRRLGQHLKWNTCGGDYCHLSFCLRVMSLNSTLRAHSKLAFWDACVGNSTNKSDLDISIRTCMGPNKAKSAERIKWEWIGPVYCEGSNPSPTAPPCAVHKLSPESKWLQVCQCAGVLRLWAMGDWKLALCRPALPACRHTLPTRHLLTFNTAASKSWMVC